MGTVSFNLQTGASSTCQDALLSTTAGRTPAQRLQDMGVDVFQLSGRLFKQTPYTTNTTAPATPATPGEAAAAAKTAANNALTEANTGLIVGAVGLALAVMGLVALAYSCHMVRAMKNQLDSLTLVKGVSDWGAPKDKAASTDTKAAGLLAGLPGTPTPQPNPLNNASLNAV